MIPPEARALLDIPITDRVMLEAFFDGVSPWEKIKWGTERVERLLAMLGHPERAMRYITVGGTNAKGSITLYIAALLQELGFTVGANLSPHISDMAERIQLAGRLISDLELIAVANIIREALKLWPEDAGDLPTYHEIWTVLSVLAFQRAGVEWAVMEVGMGGRYDAARAMPNEVAVMGPIAFDHMKYLGHTLTAIATEKVEIFPQEGLVVTSPQDPEAETVIARKVDEVHATWRRAADFPPLDPALQPGLRGHYQRDNAQVALLTILAMAERGLIARPPTPQESARALASVTQVQHPARFEMLSEHPVIWCEGGHNPAALAAFVADLLAMPRAPHLHLLLGFKEDKDIATAIRALSPLAPHRVIATQSQQLQALPAETLGAACATINPPPSEILIEPDLLAAATRWAEGIRSDPEAYGLALGSLYLAGDLRNLIQSGALPGLPWLLSPLV